MIPWGFFIICILSSKPGSSAAFLLEPWAPPVPWLYSSILHSPEHSGGTGEPAAAHPFPWVLVTHGIPGKQACSKMITWSSLAQSLFLC